MSKAESQTPPPKNLPDPVIYGPDFPRIRMVTRGGRQQFESPTNQNLFLDADWDFDRRGTFTMGRFLRQSDACRECHAKRWCPLLIDGVFGDDSDGPTVVTGADLKSPPDWEACPTFGYLRGYVEWDAQRLFFEHYCKEKVKSADLLARSLAQLAEESQGVVLSDHERVVTDALLPFPALIPEVWLNVIGRDRTVEDEAHLEHNPHRVDFVMFANGRKCVVEVDGPGGHYGRYDKVLDTYIADEELYTKNLRVERSLRRQGWSIYRFSNWEIKQAVENGTFRQLIGHLPDSSRFAVPSMDLLRQEVVGASDDDIPF